ncbi:MAG TPA: DUF3576 domain-containing protein [Stellaceae bacterium]|nr:DUF3576 domain-containing protein [Stellaceae bacterium]
MVVRVQPASHNRMYRPVQLLRFGSLALAGGLVLSLAACDSVTPSQTSQSNPKWDPYGANAQQQRSETIFGQGNNLGSFLGISPGNKGGAAPGAAGVGVNTFLWRASLDTVSFMPLASADPFGGVIITDWYAPPASPNERFKVNVFILDRELHAAGIRATVFRQTRNDANGSWTDAPVDAKIAQNLEDQILTRARQLRVSSTEIQSQK